MRTRNVAGRMWAWIGIASAFSMFSLSGCVGVLGGYQYEDMRDSRYRDIIKMKADALADSPNAGNQAAAAELYGSIGELESMDKAIMRYFDKEPELGLQLMIRGEKIHKFYRSAWRR